MIQVTTENFEQEVLKSDIPVLVDFYADWCGPCKAAAPAVEALAEEYAGKVKFAKVDVNEEANGKYAHETHGVRGIPNFILFKGGERVQQFIGWGDNRAEDIRAALDASLAS